MISSLSPTKQGFTFRNQKKNTTGKKREAREKKEAEKREKKEQQAAIKIDTEKHAKSAFSQHSEIAKNGKISTTAFKIAEV